MSKNIRRNLNMPLIFKKPCNAALLIKRSRKTNTILKMIITKSTMFQYSLKYNHPNAIICREISIEKTPRIASSIMKKMFYISSNRLSKDKIRKISNVYMTINMIIRISYGLDFNIEPKVNLNPLIPFCFSSYSSIII